MSQRKRLLSVAYQCAAAVVRESKLGAPSHSLWTKAGSMSRVTGVTMSQTAPQDAGLFSMCAAHTRRRFA